jgi:hypothetical protein
MKLTKFLKLRKFLSSFINYKHVMGSLSKDMFAV